MSWLTGWSYRKKITIDNTKVDSTLSNFPILVKRTSADTDFWSHCNSRENLTFTLSDGTTELNAEVERFDHSSDILEAWVSVDSVSSSAPSTYIYMYYDSSSPTHGKTDSTNTWNSNYKAVWHMNSADNSQIVDSTSNNNDSSEHTLDSVATGKIGKSMNGDGSEHARFGNIHQNNITVEAWAKTSVSPDRQHIVAKSPSTYVVPYYEYTIFMNSDGYVAGGCSPNGSWTYSGNSFSTYDDGNWHYIVLTYNGSTVKIDIDGGSDTNSDSASGDISEEAGDCYIAKDGTGIWTNEWNGDLDEIRISDTARTTAWIKASYNSGNNSLVSYGSEEMPTGYKTINGNAAVKVSGISKIIAGNARLGSFPVLLAPADESLTFATPTFSWIRGTEATSHKIQVDTNSSFPSPIDDVTLDYDRKIIYSNAAEGFANHLLRPAAIYVNGKTYIAFIKKIATDPYYEKRVLSYNHSTETVNDYLVSTTVTSQKDFYDKPIIVQDNDGYFHFFHAGHNSFLRWRRSSNPNDISSWDTEESIAPTGTNATYAKACVVDNGDIYVFFRQGGGHPSMNTEFIKGHWTGSEWSWDTSRTLVLKYTSSDPEGVASGCGYSRIEHVSATDSEHEKIFIFWDKERWDAPQFQHVFCAYLDLSNNNMYAMNGTQMANNTYFDAGNSSDWNACIVHNSAGRYTNQVPMGHVYDNKPYLIWSEDITGSPDYDFYFRFSRWTGSSWSTPQNIVQVSDGIVAWAWYNDFIIHNSKNIEAYLTRTNGEANVGDIEKWTWDGSTWTKVATIFSEGEFGYDFMLPVVVENFDNNLKMVIIERKPGDPPQDNRMFLYEDDSTWTKSSSYDPGTHYWRVWAQNGGNFCSEVWEFTPTVKTITGNADIKIEDISKTISSNARIKITLTKTLNGNARIEVPTTKTLGGNARIKATGIQKIVDVNSRIQLSYSTTVTTNSRIKKTFSYIISSNSRVKKSFTKTIVPTARIKVSLSKVIDVNSRVQITQTKAIDANSRIKVTFTKVIDTIGRIKAVGLTETVEITGRVTYHYTKTVQSNARIKIAYTKQIDSNSRIKVLQSSVIDTLGRIKLSNESEVTSNSRVQVSFTSTISGNARVKVPIERAIDTISRVKVLGVGKTISSTGRVTYYYEKTIESVSRIKVPFSKSITSTSRLKISQTSIGISSNARIKIPFTKIITSVSRIKLTQSKEISTNSRTKVSTVKVVSTNANIEIIGIKKIVTEARIKTTLAQEITSTARIAIPSTKVVATIARVLKSFDKLITANSRVGLTDYAMTTTNAKVIISQEKSIQGNARVKTSLSKVLSSIGRIKLASEKFITSNGRVQIGYSKVISSVGRIKTPLSKFVLSNASVKATLEQIITSNARISGIPGVAILSKVNSRIKVSSTQVVQSNSRVKISFSQAIDSIARVRKTFEKLVSSIGRIKETYTNAIVSNARVKLTGFKIIETIGRIKKTFTQEISSNANVITAGIRTIIQKARIKLTQEQLITSSGMVQIGGIYTITGNARVKLTQTKQLISNSRIKKPYETSVDSNSRIQISGIQLISSDSRVKLTRYGMIDSNGRLQKEFTTVIDQNGRVKISQSKVLTQEARVSKEYSKVIAASGYITVGRVITTNARILKSGIAKVIASNASISTIILRKIEIDTIVSTGEADIIVDTGILDIIAEVS